MSLNRSEKLVQDYLLSHTEERLYWQDRVRREAAASEDVHTAAAVLDRELWRYFEERATVVEPFCGFVRREGGARTSMRGLAELLLRLWAPAPARPKAGPGAV